MITLGTIGGVMPADTYLAELPSDSGGGDFLSIFTGVFTAENDTDGEEPGAVFIPERDEEIIDFGILAALFTPPPNAQPQADFSEPAASEAEITAAQVIPILEGNQGVIDPNALQPPDIAAWAAADLARMPQAIDQQTPDSEEKSFDFSQNDVPCPLENVNNSVEQYAYAANPAETPAEKSVTPRAAADKSAAPAAGDKPKEVYTLPTYAAVNISPEKVSAAQQMKAAAPDAPVAKENLIEELVERIEYMREADTNQMSVQLKPEYLGKVSLTLSMTEGGVQVKINAADPGVRAMINGQIDTLIENLSEKGIRVERMDVVYTGVGENSYTDPNARGQSRHNAQSKFGNARRTAGVRVASGAETEQVSVVDVGLSSVEYSA
ncbi:MAG: flagellar hook-length control protein FliK [Oscillospiraceae bacterium]|jgi:flagellar hook-length control protein FliK|nr:flagellar hook-length control protein FliK [Oscillospiraceae bacterium]